MNPFKKGDLVRLLCCVDDVKDDFVTVARAGVPVTVLGEFRSKFLQLISDEDQVEDLRRELALLRKEQIDAIRAKDKAEAERWELEGRYDEVLQENHDLKRQIRNMLEDQERAHLLTDVLNRG